MAKKPAILIDLNIILDVLQKREPFYKASAGILAAVSLTTLFYLVQKDKSSAEARATITNLLQFIQVAPVDQSTIEQALNLDYRDFEDAVPMISAVQCKVDCLVTRNVKDYQPALLPVVKPVDFLSTLV
jgi:predicted nucleic acid-binding protein